MIEGKRTKAGGRTEHMAQLHAQGFDRSAFSGMKHIKPACSQCAVIVINGTPCHETGCPNQTFECKGCNNTVSRKGAYCEDCQ